MSFPNYDGESSSCGLTHISSFETTVINCAKAFVRAYRRNSDPRAHLWHDDALAERIGTLMRAVDEMEKDESAMQPVARKKSQKRSTQKARHTKRIKAKRPGGITKRSSHAEKGHGSR